MVARQLHISFTSNGAVLVLPLDGDSPLPIDGTGGLCRDQLLVLELRLKRQGKLKMRIVNCDSPAGRIGNAGHGAEPVTKHSHMQSASRQVQTLTGITYPSGWRIAIND